MSSLSALARWSSVMHAPVNTTNAVLRSITAMRSAHTEALIYFTHGPPAEVLHLKEAPELSELPVDSIRVKMLAAPINPSDINQIEGRYPIKPPLPAVGGNEGVGQVQNLGSEVSGMSCGDWVIPLEAGQGTWRQDAQYKALGWHSIPRGIPLATAACLSVNAVTAMRMLTEFEALQPGSVVIQNGGNSGVGRAVIQIAKAKGIRTVSLIRNSARLEELGSELAAQGADLVTTEDSLKADLASSQLPKPRLALNCIGGSSSAAIAKSLEAGGTLVTYGGMSMMPVTIPTSLFIFKNITSRGFWLSAEDRLPHNREKKANAIDEVVKLVQSGRFTVSGELLPISDFARAFQPSTKGKQILTFE